MAYIGAKYPVFAPIATQPAGAIPTYSAGAVVGRAIEMNESVEFNDAPLYSDDAQSENDKSFKKGKFSTGLDDLTRAIKKLWFGMTEVAEGGQTVLKDAATYDSPYGGFGFYRIRKKGGVRTIEGHWYYKTKWTRPNNEAKTKGESVEWQTPKVEGEIMAVEDTVGSWHGEVEFATEAEAVAWLQGLALITTPDALTLSSSSPVDGNAAGSKTNAITLTFGNVMNQFATKAVLLTALGVLVATTPSWDATGKILSLAHAALTGATAHLVTYSAVDAFGQALAGAIDFTTVA